MAGRIMLFALLLCAVVVTVCKKKRAPKCPKPTDEDREKCRPCRRVRSTKQVTLVVRNVLREPYFEETVTLNCTRYVTLFHIMQDAADANSAFRFTVKYFGSSLGFFVEAINDVYGNFTLDKSYWMILDGENSPTPVGVSSYKPKKFETVTFNLTNEVDFH